MKSAPCNLLLACTALLVCGAADAVPRGEVVELEPPTPEQREAQRLQKEQDMAAWLPRLVGRFKLEGVADTRPLSAQMNPDNPAAGLYYAMGKADCIGVGAGPGVHCVIFVAWDVTWDEDGRVITDRDPSLPPAAGLMGEDPFLAPAAVLFGFDPGAAKFRSLMLDSRGVAEEGPGLLNGFTARLVFPVNATYRRILRIRAKPEGSFLQMTIDDESLVNGAWIPDSTYNFDMRHVPQDNAVEAAHGPDGK